MIGRGDMGVPMPIIVLIALMMTLFAGAAFFLFKKRATIFAPQTIDPKPKQRDDQQ